MKMSFVSLPFRLHELRNVVEAVSLLLHTPHLLPPLSAARLSTISHVLVGCFQAACQATVALSALPAKKKETGQAGITDSEKSKEGESKKGMRWERGGRGEWILSSGYCQKGEGRKRVGSGGGRGAVGLREVRTRKGE